METLLICLLLLYNAWLVTYILFGRKKRDNTVAEERPPFKPPKREDGIVGKSRFKMEGKPPITANTPPSTAIEPEGEDITDIAVTFADEMPSKREQSGNEFPAMPNAAGIMQNEETPSARLREDKLDEAFEDIRISDVPQEYDEDEQERAAARGYATGASFEEIGAAIKVADNPSATPQERKQAGQIFSEMEGNTLFNQIINSSPDRARKISGLMDEISNKPISGEREAVGVSVHPQNKAGVKVPADISGFDIRDFV